MPLIQTEQWIPAVIATVFAFFSDPRNLPRLMPPELHVRVEHLRLVSPTDERVVQSGAISGAGLTSALVAGEGSEVEISFRLIPFLPLRCRWTARIVEFSPGVRFRDVQLRGPMKSWRHSHEFRREIREGVEGTIIRDFVEYELPLGVLGRIADALFVSRLLQSSFRSRQRTLEQILL